MRAGCDPFEVAADHGAGRYGWQIVLGWLREYLDRPRYFYCRLLVPRIDFATTMTGDELALMQGHAEYWARVARRGEALIAGAVEDSSGRWNLVIARARDLSELQTLQSQDPLILAGRGFRYESSPIASDAVDRSAQEPR